MKKLFIILLSLLATTCLLASCAPETTPDASNAGSTSQTDAASYTEEDVTSQFLSQTEGQANTVMDCVVAEDHAYDLMGVVLFTNQDKPDLCRIGFLKQDGTLRPMGLYALPADDTGLTYLGNGQVSVSLIQQETGVAYQCKVTFSEENGTPSFQVWDSLSQEDGASSDLG